MTHLPTRSPASTARPAAVQDPGADGLSPARDGFRSVRAPDRIARRILGVTEVDPRSGAGAHRAFRISVVVSALRCLITYVAIPVIIPVLSLSGRIAGPVGIALCVIAAVNGVISVRRFWRADHPQRWTYTAFIAVVFIVLTFSLWTETTTVVTEL